MPVIRYILKKSSNKILKIIKKCWFWGQKYSIYPILGITIFFFFFQKKGFISFFVYWIQTSCKKTEKHNELIQSKKCYRRTDRSGRGEFIGPFSKATGQKKRIFVLYAIKY